MLLESVIDWTQKELDPHICIKSGDSYHLRSEVKHYSQDVSNYIDTNIVQVNDIFIKGSILSYQWLDHTDIDLLLEIDQNIDDESWRRLQDHVDQKYQEETIPGTNHPLQIYLNRGHYDLGNADGVLYLDKREWGKGPYNLSVNVNDYMDKFQKTVMSIDTASGELKRDLIDYQLMQSLPVEAVDNIRSKLAKKLDEINQDVSTLIDQYKHVKDLRHLAFSEDMSPQDIAKYGSKNKLPDNVIFKLMERYQYFNWMWKLRDLFDDGNIDDDDVEQVEQLAGEI